MTDEEKAEEILQTKGSMTFCAKGCQYTEKVKELIAIGLAEGKKEVAYMKAEEYDKYLDACRKNIELEKEKADLQQRLDWAQGFLDKDVEYDELNKLRKENAEQTAQIEKLKSDYEHLLDEKIEIEDRLAESRECY